MAILKKRCKFEDSNCDEYTISIWKRENDEVDADIEKYFVSIENKGMAQIDFQSISDIEKMIEELQNAIKFIFNKESEGLE